MAKHTPGPWEYGELEGDTIYLWAYRNEADDEGVLVATATREEVETKACEANARLIAAAPGYHQAVVDLLALWPLSGYELEAYMGSTFVPAVRAAFRKAKGVANG
jgi:hypothetical protein